MTRSRDSAGRFKQEKASEDRDEDRDEDRNAPGSEHSRSGGGGSARVIDQGVSCEEWQEEEK